MLCLNKPVRIIWIRTILFYEVEKTAHSACLMIDKILILKEVLDSLVIGSFATGSKQ